MNIIFIFILCMTLTLGGVDNSFEPIHKKAAVVALAGMIIVGGIYFLKSSREEAVREEAIHLDKLTAYKEAMVLLAPTAKNASQARVYAAKISKHAFRAERWGSRKATIDLLYEMSIGNIFKFFSTPK